MENARQLVNCKTGVVDEIRYDILSYTINQIQYCYLYRDKYFFFFCQNYCENFDIAHSSTVLEGNLPLLRKFVDFFQMNRQGVFKHPDQNFMTDQLSIEESFLKNHFNLAIANSQFYKSEANAQVKLEMFNTDIEFEGGIELFALSEGNTYPLMISGGLLVKMAAALWMGLFVAMQ